MSALRKCVINISQMRRVPSIKSESSSSRCLICLRVIFVIGWRTAIEIPSPPSNAVLTGLCAPSISPRSMSYQRPLPSNQVTMTTSLFSPTTSVHRPSSSKMMQSKRLVMSLISSLSETTTTVVLISSRTPSPAYMSIKGNRVACLSASSSPSRRIWPKSSLIVRWTSLSTSSQNRSLMIVRESRWKALRPRNLIQPMSSITIPSEDSKYIFENYSKVSNLLMRLLPFIERRLRLS